jgi:hypothetical protein
MDSLGGIQDQSAFSFYGMDAQKSSGAKSDETAAGKELSKDQERAVDELKEVDRKVRAHEAAHLAAAGGLATSGASYSYATGPDGKRYAVGGEVKIDTSPVKGNPQATIQKMEQVKRAALAPADPSGQDRSVASAASSTEAEARKELNAKQAAVMSSALHRPAAAYKLQTTKSKLSRVYA